MLAVALTREDAERLIDGYAGRVAIGAINSKLSLTLTGETVALNELAAILNERSIFCRFLKVEVPYHSAFMDSIREDLLLALGGLQPRSAAVPLYSTVTGRLVDGSELDADYWWRNVRQPVEFHSAVGRILEGGYSAFLEIGAHPVLSASLVECLREAHVEGASLASLRRNEPDSNTMLGSLGRLHTLGVPVDWRKLYKSGGCYVRLPPNPWQHEKHWHESEESRQDRLGKSGHPLLGKRADSAKASWAADLDLNTLAYLGDHRVHDAIVFPAAAYVEMALAAGREAFGQTACVLEDVMFRKALLLSPGDPARTEIMLDVPGAFEISSRNSAAWTLHATGKIRPLPPGQGPKNRDLVSIRRQCPAVVEKSECYRLFAAMGLNYGPKFRTLERLWTGDSQALGEIRLLADSASEVGDYGCHPAVLDASFQVLIGTMSNQAPNDSGNLFLPVGINKIAYYSNFGASIHAHAILTNRSAKEVAGNITVLDEEGNCVAEIVGFTCRAVDHGLDRTQRWLYEYRWKPESLPQTNQAVRDAAHLCSPGQLVRELDSELAILKKRLARDRYYEAFLPAADRLAASHVRRGLLRLGYDPELDRGAAIDLLSEKLGVLPEYRRLLARLLDGLEQLPGEDGDPAEMYQALWEEYPDAQAELVLLWECGEMLPEVLRGSADPLNLIFPEGTSHLAEHLYQDSPAFRIYNLLIQKAIQQICGLLADGRMLRILELGGGTGGTTASILPILPQGRVEYVFTDVAPMLVSQAAQKFREYSFVEYRTLDVESDPAAQGFAPHSFDLIVASDVLHATRDLRLTLRHVAALLSSEGELAMIEGVRPRLGVTMVFGLLRGWWLFEDEAVREKDPWIAPRRWQELLQEAGFGETAYLTDHAEASEAMHAVLIARGPRVALPAEAPAPEAGVWLMYADEGRRSNGPTALELASQLRAKGDRVILAQYGEAFARLGEELYSYRPGVREDLDQLTAAFSPPPERWRGIVYLCGLDAAAAGEEDDVGPAMARAYNGLLHLAQALGAGEREIPQLCVVTRGAAYVPASPGDIEVLQAPLWGVTRVVMTEHPNLHCRLVDVGLGLPQRHGAWRSGCGDAEIRSLADELSAAPEEDEVALRGEIRYVHRLAPALLAALRQSVPKWPGAAFRLEAQRIGMLDSVAGRPIARRAPAAGEVEVEVAAAGLNFKDVMLSMGLLPEDAAEGGLGGNTLGMECSGSIVATGPDVHDLAVGDQVIACGPGSLASHLTIDANLVVRKPADMTLEEAATVPIAFLTAHYALHVLGRMQSGDRVLIHAATGGVGLAALQMARRAGAEVLATAGSPAKRRLLRALGVRHVMDSRSVAFADEILESTGGEGVDIVLNSLSGEAIPKSLSILRPYGRFLEIGKRDIYEDSRLGLRPFRKNLAFFSVALDRLCAQRPELARSLS